MTGQYKGSKEIEWLGFEEFIKKNPIPARITVLAHVLVSARSYKKRKTRITLVYVQEQGGITHATLVTIFVDFHKIQKIPGDENLGVIISTKPQKGLPVQAGTFTLVVTKYGVCYQPPKEMFRVPPQTP